MSCNYSIPLRGIAARAGMLRGETTPGVETSYAMTPLTQAELGNGPYPLTMLQDALLDAEEQLATTIADTGNHPWRAYLMSLTAPLANGAVLPSVDASDNPIIGIRGSILDATDQAFVCTEQPTEVIRRWQQTQSYWIQEFYYYRVTDKIIHTRDAVVIQVCVYNRDTQQDALVANDPMLLPDALEQALVAGGVAALGVDSAPFYRQSFNAAIAAIRSGLTSVPAVAMAGPTLESAIST